MARDKEKRKSLALVRTQTMERAQGNAAPIEFRTLSIHVTETHRSGKNGGMPAYGKEREAKSSRFWKGKSKEDVLVTETDFFSTVDFHKLSESEINLRFNSDPTSGLTQPEADRRLKANGLNTLESPKPNYFKMILGYTFGGFCSILWVGVITFLICWQPPLSPTPNVTNLALAILVVSIFDLFMNCHHCPFTYLNLNLIILFSNATTIVICNYPSGQLLRLPRLFDCQGHVVDP